MLTRARAEAAALLEGIPSSRPAVIRRAIPEDWMLATDLPRAAETAGVDRFQQKAAAAGWQVAEADGWLLLDRPELLSWPEPDAFPADGEAGCVMSLLRRHPEFRSDRTALRSLAKASELPEAQREAVCRNLHGRWAEALRRDEYGKGETGNAD